MSEHTVRRCDECLTMHGEVNNWWCVVGDPERPTFITFEQADRMTGEALDHHKQLNRLDYCSHACVGTAFHRWLDTGNVVKQECVVTESSEEAEYAALVS